jgi:hypothetical protein
MKWINVSCNAADCVTGERCFPGSRVFDTGIKKRKSLGHRWNNYANQVLKEETIVELAEAAGYTLSKRDVAGSDAGVIVDAENVDESDVSVGGGKAAAGTPKAGRKPSVK